MKTKTIYCALALMVATSFPAFSAESPPAAANAAAHLGVSAQDEARATSPNARPITVASYYFGNYHPGDARNTKMKGKDGSEWTEGSYLEPDQVHGMKYLEAVKEVFGAGSSR